ncbi:helix-turn-helix domain-containing protein [Pelobacter propionicus]|uniref:Transcriptional regulator, XRE family n=1 Tax=Pelobacter propionicus (strain DSM 2379 / NBRC 103807 / OttBd1) TaxID=338966 RepID=A1ANU5_PELPD|nr:helix-turn-helix transcriptional regulator [Pelobacter propionicus]ABK99015.1 transcriptional regulator, XRE family [Pelobacter propionicus DSM 2379]
MENEFVSRIKAAFNAMGVAKRGVVKEVAVKTGYSEGMVSRILAGKNEPSEKFLLSVAAAYGIRPDWVLKGEEPILSPGKGFTIASIDRQIFMEVARSIAGDPQPSTCDQERIDREVFGHVSDERRDQERTIITVLQKRWLTDDELAQVEKLVSDMMNRKQGGR